MDPDTGPAPGSWLTLRAWGELLEDADGELVDGRLVEDEMTGWAHETVVVFLAAVMRAWVRPRGGLVGGSEIKFAISQTRGRKADLSIYLPDAPRPPPAGVVSVPPSIVVEVVSPSPRDARRDRVEKLEDYASFGVRWYWLVDPQLQTFEVFELDDDGRYAIAFTATHGRLDALPGCTGLTIDLDALWAELAELAE